MFKCKWKISGHQGPVYAISWNGIHLYSSSSDKYVARWDLETGEQDSTFTVKLDHAAYCIESIANYCFIGCTDGTFYALDTPSKKVLWEVNFAGNTWSAICYIPIKNWVVVGDFKGNVIVFDAETGKRIIHLPLAVGKIRKIVSKNSNLYVSTQDAGIHVFDLSNWNELVRWTPHETGCRCFGIDSITENLVSGGRDGRIVVSDSNFSVIHRIPAHYQAIYGLVQLDDYWISCSMDKSIKVWDASLTRVIQKIDVKSQSHNRSVNDLVMINQSTFASCSDDKTIIIWNKI